MVIQYADADCKFLEKNASKVPYDGQDWYYFPFWMRKIGDGLFVPTEWNDIPDGLKEEILFHRNLQTKEIKNISQQGEPC